MIGNLLEIVQNSVDPYRSDRLTVWQAQNDCANFVFVGLTTCAIDPPDAGFYAQITWNPIEFVDVIDGNENIEGELIKFMHRKRGRLSFGCIVDEAQLNAMNVVSMHQSMSMRDLVTNEIWGIEDMTITAVDATDVIQATVSFRVKGADTIVTACCESLYAGAPFEDPCDPDGGTPPPNGDCSDYDVVIAYDALNDTLTANPSGTAVGTDTFQWLYDNGTGFVILSSTAQVITATEAGTYRVNSTRVGCVTSSDFLLQADCVGFDVVLTYENGVLIASANMVSTFAWTLDTVPIVGETGATLIPTDAGTYEVTATADTCEDTDSVLVNTVDMCLLDFALDLVGDVLIVSDITDCNGSPSYVWEVDNGDGNGFVVIALALSDNWQLHTSGLFRVTVTCDGDGCAKSKQIVAISDCIAFRGYIASVVDHVSGVELTAAHANAPAAVVFDWYKHEGDAWVLQFTGNPYIIADGGGAHQVKLVATSGQCVREDYLEQCIDPADFMPYQQFVAVGANENNFAVTAFTLIQPDDQGGTATPNDINARYLVEKNGLVLTYSDLVSIPASVNAKHYSYNFSTNEIILPDAFVLFSGDRLSIFDREA